MFSKSKRASARLDSLMFDCLAATLGIYVAVINRLAFDAIRRRSGLEPPAGSDAAMAAAIAAVARDRGWQRQCGGGIVHEPELLAAWYEEVLSFSDQQLGNSAISEPLSDMSAEASEVDEQFGVLNRSVLDMALNRRVLAWDTASTMNDLNMEDGPVPRGEVPAELAPSSNAECYA